MQAQITKRDHACLWFKHLPEALTRLLADLAPGEVFVLLINDGFTQWTRMNPQPSGAPTMGIKITAGHALWNPMSLGDEFVAKWRSDSDSEVAPNVRSIETSSPSLLERGDQKTRLFDWYLFADYSGAKSQTVQRRAIQAVMAKGDGNMTPLGGYTRLGLTQLVLARLHEATRNRVRVCAGFDHQYSIPISLAREIGVSDRSWRQLLRDLVSGTYSPDAPPLAAPGEFAPRFNDWLRSKGHADYFWSATKAEAYGIPNHQPRQTGLMRLTETAQPVGNRATPKPFCRLGDNGSVGGQTLHGLRHLHDLLEACKANRLPVKVWPFDGLDIVDYSGYHVLLEPYPSIVAKSDLKKSDLNDAKAALLMVQQHDSAGTLVNLLSLAPLREEDKETVLLEGWIAGFAPIILEPRS